MKNRLFISLILIIIVIAVGGMFWYGENIIHGSANHGYSIIAFENVESKIDVEKNNFSALNFSIENREPAPTDYSITIFINGKQTEIGTKNIGKDAVTVNPEIKTKNAILALPHDEIIKFEAKIMWNEQTETISKTILFLP